MIRCRAGPSDTFPPESVFRRSVVGKIGYHAGSRDLQFINFQNRGFAQRKGRPGVSNRCPCTRSCSSFCPRTATSSSPFPAGPLDRYLNDLLVRSTSGQGRDNATAGSLVLRTTSSDRLDPAPLILLPFLPAQAAKLTLSIVTLLGEPAIRRFAGFCFRNQLPSFTLSLKAR